MNNDALLLAYARVWFAGRSPVAPGSCGSFAGLLLAPLLFMPLPVWGRLILLAVVLYTGVKASGRAAEILGEEDPPEVVIDEVLGQWITCLPFTAMGVWEYLAAFALFRFFDIVKPWPARRMEALPGGLGIMLDDAAAGCYAMICLGALRCLLPY